MIRTAFTAACAAAALFIGVAPLSAQRGIDQGGAIDAVADRVGAQFMVFDTGVTGEAHDQFMLGLALLHSFEYDRAAAAFRQSQMAAPDFVMAYWGEAMTHNHPLWAQQDREAARAILARLGDTANARRAKARTAREAAWLNAIETLYGETGTKHERDFLYLEKMQELLAADPKDIDARAFTGLAVLGTSHGGRDIATYMQAASVMEPGFMTHERHPGILHYLIHSYDDPVHAPLGERMAERYAIVAPDAGHAQHMISHIYHALADWDSSEKANVLADGVVDRQRAAAGRGPNDCGHYNEWLVYARLQQGKDASDIVSACRDQAEAYIASNSNPSRGGILNSYATIAAWQGVDAGIWPETVEGISDGYHYARLRLAHASALAAIGDADAVSAKRAEFDGLYEMYSGPVSERSENKKSSLSWLDRASAQMEAIAVLSQGDTAAALDLLNAAGEAESALPVVFGPPMIAKPSFELLGEELLKLARKREAADAFRRSLEFAPGRLLSVRGLALAQAE